MERTRSPWYGHICLLAILALPLASATAAVSDKEFEKCQKMLQKQSRWLIEKADDADRKHERKVTTLIDRHVENRPQTALERVRITGIIDRLVVDFDWDRYRRVLIDEPTDELLSAENDEDFECWEQLRVRQTFNNHFRSYKLGYVELEKSIKERLGLEKLSPDEGLVVILFYARGFAETVIIDRLGSLGGGITFGPISNGDYFRVVKAKAGTYRWHSVTNRTWNGRMTAFFKQSELDFKVEAGKLNYVGAFLYKNVGSGRYRMDVFDRVSLLLSLLENRYPELLDIYEIHNGIDAENRFLNYYLQERRKHQSSDDNA